MNEQERLKIASVIKTLRRVSVQDGDDNNLARMATCINALVDLIKEGKPNENPG